jgi:hypothetical protein
VEHDQAGDRLDSRLDHLQTRKEAKLYLSKHIEIFYNRQRDQT